MRLTISIALLLLAGCASPHRASEPQSDSADKAAADTPAEPESPTRYSWFGIDVAPIMGNHYIKCGEYQQLYLPDVSRLPSERALKCARQAQSARRAFIYAYHRVEIPDVDMSYTLAVGAKGERILLESGDFGDEIGTGFVGVCDKARVVASGEIETENCRPDDPVIERLRIK